MKNMIASHQKQFEDFVYQITVTKAKHDCLYQMNTSADSQGMEGKATERREHDEPSQTENKTSPLKTPSKRMLAIGLEAIERKSNEHENKTTSRQKSFEELLKRIS